jgi:hypothetical protein
MIRSRLNTKHIDYKFIELFCIQFFYYLVITINYRAVVVINYTTTFITDLIIAALAFTSIQRVANATTPAERIAYVLGGAIGALAALKLSTHIL